MVFTAGGSILSGSQHFGADMIHQTKFAVQNFEIVENAKVFLPQGIGFS